MGSYKGCTGTIMGERFRGKKKKLAEVEGKAATPAYDRGWHDSLPCHRFCC